MKVSLTQNVGQKNLVNRAYRSATKGAWTNIIGAHALAATSVISGTQGHSTISLFAGMMSGQNVTEFLNCLKIRKNLKPQYNEIKKRAKQIYSK